MVVRALVRVAGRVAPCRRMSVVRRVILALGAAVAMVDYVVALVAMKARGSTG